METRDIAPSEVVAGGSIATESTGQRLRDQGVRVLGSVKAAAEEIANRMKKDLGLG